MSLLSLLLNRAIPKSAASHATLTSYATLFLHSRPELTSILQLQLEKLRIYGNIEVFGHCVNVNLGESLDEFFASFHRDLMIG
jgi:hypothetical protein